MTPNKILLLVLLMALESALYDCHFNLSYTLLTDLVTLFATGIVSCYLCDLEMIKLFHQPVFDQGKNYD